MKVGPWQASIKKASVTLTCSEDSHLLVVRQGHLVTMAQKVM